MMSIHWRFFSLVLVLLVDVSASFPQSSSTTKKRITTTRHSTSSTRIAGTTSVTASTTVTTTSTSSQEALTSTKQLGTASGECVGNDSRCKDSSWTQCLRLQKEGSDCQWEEHTGALVTGTCEGNDSRCSGSRAATCHRLRSSGSDCIWESSMSSGASGKCLGNDSRCGASNEAQCHKLTQEGSDCKWRAAFSAAGSLSMIVSDVQDLVNSPSANMAVAEGIANTTGVPSGYVDVDLFAELLRRRLGTRLLSQSGVLIVSYVISVNADAPSSVTVTGADVGRKLAVENIAEIEASISSSVDQSLGAGSFALSVQKINVAEVKVQLGNMMVRLGGSSTSSASIMPSQTKSSTSIMPSSTNTVTNQQLTTSTLSSTVSATVASTQTASTTTHRDVSTTMPIEMSGSRCNTCEVAHFAICTALASLWLQ